jgi:hypothetical protein
MTRAINYHYHCRFYCCSTYRIFSVHFCHKSSATIRITLNLRNSFYQQWMNIMTIIGHSQVNRLEQTCHISGIDSVSALFCRLLTHSPPIRATCPLPWCSDLSVSIQPTELLHFVEESPEKCSVLIDNLIMWINTAWCAINMNRSVIKPLFLMMIYQVN